MRVSLGLPTLLIAITVWSSSFSGCGNESDLDANSTVQQLTVNGQVSTDIQTQIGHVRQYFELINSGNREAIIADHPFIKFISKRYAVGAESKAAERKYRARYIKEVDSLIAKFRDSMNLETLQVAVHPKAAVQGVYVATVDLDNGNKKTARFNVFMQLASVKDGSEIIDAQGEIDRHPAKWRIDISESEER